MSRATLAVLVVVSSDGDVLRNDLDVSDGHADVALLAAGAALRGLRDLRGRSGCRSSFVSSSCLGGSSLGCLTLAGGSVAGFCLRVDDVGGGVVVNGGSGGLGSGSSRASRGLLDGRSAGSLGRSGGSLLGGLRCSIYVTRVNLA